MRAFLLEDGFWSWAFGFWIYFQRPKPEDQNPKTKFMNIEEIKEGLTFDDVLLIPAYSDILPSETNVATRFSRNISLNIPLCTSAMDTVTEASLAIALAQQGGIGVIHKNFSIEEQAEEVDKVKRSESGMIVDPVTIHQDGLVSDALTIMS